MQKSGNIDFWPHFLYHYHIKQTEVQRRAEFDKAYPEGIP